MKLGLTSAILFDMALEGIAKFLAGIGIPYVEPMCWPQGSGDKRKFAGTTHVDVTRFNLEDAARTVNMLRNNGVGISALGYYPNPLDPDLSAAKTVRAHLRKVILAAEKLDVRVVNTFVGRDWTIPLEDNWKRFEQAWPKLVQFAADHNVSIAIENCPMRFTRDEWPGGKNLACSPAAWRRMFDIVNLSNFGLDLDPSHLILQHIDPVAVVEEFGGYIFHVHAKDMTVDAERLYEVGVLADNPNDWHTPKLPGRGQVPWGSFFQALRGVGYDGVVSIEVEDPEFKTLEERQQAVIESAAFLGPYLEESQEEQTALEVAPGEIVAAAEEGESSLVVGPEPVLAE